MSRRSYCCGVFGTLALACSLIAGCGNKGGGNSAPQVSAELMGEVASAEQKFAVDLYARLAEEAEGENLFFSPHSVYSVLAMAAEGAAGETAGQMAEVLGLQSGGGESQFAKTHQGLAGLAYRLRGGGKDSHQLFSANALWVDKRFPLAASYTRALKPHLSQGSGVFACDFHTSYTAEAARIDQWCSDHTRGHIRNIMPELSSDKAKLLHVVLTNAVYFEGRWVQPFESHDSTERTFYLASGEDIKVATMFMHGFQVGRYGAVAPAGEWFATPATYNPSIPQKEQGLYPAAGGFTMAELPYQGDQVSMVLLLPRTRDSLPQVETLVTAERLAGWMAKLESRPISRLRLPKLDLDTTYGLEEVLADLGMPLAFSEPSPSGGADFSRMVTATEPARRVFISSVIHKATLQVDELGTVAAAATAAMLADSAEAMPEEEAPFHPAVIADHPFLLLIRDNDTGAILFMGRVNDPR